MPGRNGDLGDFARATGVSRRAAFRQKAVCPVSPREIPTVQRMQKTQKDLPLAPFPGKAAASRKFREDSNVNLEMKSIRIYDII